MCARQYFICLEKIDGSEQVYKRQATADVRENLLTWKCWAIFGGYSWNMLSYCAIFITHNRHNASIHSKKIQLDLWSPLIILLVFHYYLVIYWLIYFSEKARVYDISWPEILYSLNSATLCLEVHACNIIESQLTTHFSSLWIKYKACLVCSNMLPLSYSPSLWLIKI